MVAITLTSVAPVQVRFGGQVIPIGLGENTTAARTAMLRAETARDRAESAAVAAQGNANFRATMAEALADFAVGIYFTSTDTGAVTTHPNELRLYKRTSGSPGYTDQGDNAAPVAKSAVAPTIWRKLPSRESHDSLGTGMQNSVYLQNQVNRLDADGGGILTLVDDVIDMAFPPIIPPKVSIIGLGPDKTLLRNVYDEPLAGGGGTFRGYDFRQSQIFVLGNFHPIYTYQMVGHANSKPLNAVAKGENWLTLTNSGDAAGYAVGDYVVPFTPADLYMTGPIGGLFGVYKHMTTRRITAINGSVLSVDLPLRDSFTSGYLYNLRTGTIIGAPNIADGITAGVPLYCWGEAEIAGFSIDTPGYWLADSACHRGRFSDIDIVRARALHYGNTFTECVFDKVGGNYMIAATELSLNSEHNEIRNFSGIYDGAAAAALSAVLTAGRGTSVTVAHSVTLSLQENGIYNRVHSGSYDVTQASGGPVLRTINAERCEVDVMVRHHGSSFTGDVVSVGDVGVSGAGRRVNSGTKVRADWQGPCGNYVNMLDSATTKAEIDGTYRGTPTGYAVRITDTANRNQVRGTYDEGLLFFGSGVSAQDVRAYVGGGVRGMTADSEYDYMTLNVVDLQTSKTAARAAGNKALRFSQTLTGSSTETDVLSSDIGTGSLQRGDVIEYDLRCNCSGTNNVKRLFFYLDNVTDGTSTALCNAVIAAASPGIYKFAARALVSNTALVITTFSTITGVATVTPTEAGYTGADLSTKHVKLRIAIKNDSPSDTNVIAAARVGLRHERQK